MIKKILSIVGFLSLAFVGTIEAQVPSRDAAFSPKQGDLAISLNFGVSSYIGQDAPAPNLGTQNLAASTANWFSKTPMLDIEGRYFLTDKWAVKISGGFGYNYSPGYAEKTGTGTGNNLVLGEIPTYSAIPSSSNIQFAITVGADHYLSFSSNDRMKFRLGGEFGYAYGRISSVADNLDYAGKSIGEAFAFRLAPVAGADYALSSILVLGFELRPISYNYSVYGIRPQAGLGMMKSDNHSFNFLAQPMVKLGFKF